MSVSKATSPATVDVPVPVKVNWPPTLKAPEIAAEGALRLALELSVISFGIMASVRPVKVPERVALLIVTPLKLSILLLKDVTVRT